MKVTLLCHTPDPERVVAAAAKLCYAVSDLDRLMEGLTPEATKEFIGRLISMGHESPLEHASFTFCIEGVSRSLLAQITRHRIASFSVRSQRYIDESEFEYITPLSVCIAGDDAVDEYADVMKFLDTHYRSLSAKIKKARTRSYVKDGMSLEAAIKKAEKDANEDARFVLPNACTTRMIMTINARSLLNFFKHRCCTRAQWEIRLLADEMLRLVSEVAPNLFKNAGPPCVKGACTEGSMSCGNAEEVRRHYNNLKGVCE